MPSARELLQRATAELETEVQSGCIQTDKVAGRAARVDDKVMAARSLERVKARWQTLNDRLELAPGKEVLTSVNRQLAGHGLSLTPQGLLAHFTADVVPADLVVFLRSMEKLSTG